MSAIFSHALPSQPAPRRGNTTITFKPGPPAAQQEDDE